MKILIIFLIFVLPKISFSFFDFRGCGEYKIMGIPKKNADSTGYSLFVQQLTKSEYQLIIDIKDELKLAPYVNHLIQIDAIIEKNLNGYKGSIAKVVSIVNVPKDPINIKIEDSFILIRKIDCQK